MLYFLFSRARMMPQRLPQRWDVHRQSTYLLQRDSVALWSQWQQH